jgi:[acyl-carrier-protein] S-malonyltransferase
MATAVIFAGQGAQYPGMGKDLYDKFDSVKDLFDAFESVRPDIKELCFNGSKDDLSRTVNTQPAVYAVDTAGALALREMGLVGTSGVGTSAAGFSLGELAALAYAEVYDFVTGFKLVCRRAEIMDGYAGKVESGMAAVLKLTSEQVETIAARYDGVYPVNYNCPGQIVVSGLKSEIQKFAADAESAGGRIMSLPVSGAFHSPFMNEAAEEFKTVLDSFTFEPPKIPVYANWTAEKYVAANIKETLAMQICSPVKWEQSVNNMIKDGIDTFIESGAGKTLSGFVKRINKDMKILNIENASDIEAIKAAVHG